MPFQIKSYKYAIGSSIPYQHQDILTIVFIHKHSEKFINQLQVRIFYIIIYIPNQLIIIINSFINLCFSSLKKQTYIIIFFRIQDLQDHLRKFQGINQNLYSQFNKNCMQHTECKLIIASEKVSIHKF
ncbi:unnamed protein product [Paramecium octaurelia]|uniref:Transmembrane protein n=1 Tax=Paramecium octaurelia TaxID=43137 RepID=A0A8S1W887_PAROT|nr:unnamed protein product [Paramecium octaurelia]